MTLGRGNQLRRLHEPPGEDQDNNLYLDLLQRIDEGLIICSDEIIVEVNRAACALLKRPHQELLDQPLRTLFASDEQFLQACTKLFIEQKPQTRMNFSQPDGKKLTLCCRCEPAIAPGLHALIFSAPAKQNRRRPNTPEEDITLSEQLAANIDQPVLTINRENRICSANNAAQKYLHERGKTLVIGQLIYTLELTDKDMRSLGSRHAERRFIFLGN